jgi:hypothetical protein
MTSMTTTTERGRKPAIEGARAPLHDNNITIFVVGERKPRKSAIDRCASMLGTRTSECVADAIAEQAAEIERLRLRVAALERRTRQSVGPLATPPETMRGLHHFQTLAAAEDLLYVAGDDTIYAFVF